MRNFCSARSAMAAHKFARRGLREGPPGAITASDDRSEATVNYLGIQVESDEELHEMREKLAHADRPVVEQEEASCCYAESNKHWVQNPQGIAWETFHTLSSIPVFGEDTRTSLGRIPVKAASCCVPKLD